MSRIRVLIVDDAVVVRRIVSDVIAADPELEVAGIAANGQIALAKILQLNPDVVTMDVEMPIMGGIETVRALRIAHPRLPVIMFSTLTEAGASATLDALLAGADDYVTKPANVGSVSLAIERIRSQLIPKIKALRNGRGRGESAAKNMVASSPRAPSQPAASQLPTRPATNSASPTAGAFGLLTIGCSTGGPNALADIIPKLPRDLPVPIAIVQHMPPLFTKLLAQRLTAQWGGIVKEAEHGEVLRSGQAYIAPGDFHLSINHRSGSLIAELNQDAPENFCRPAVDVMLRSAARVCGPRMVTVILTGMGSDGLRGCTLVHEAGGRILAQDRESSVVWGMPGAVAGANLPEQLVPLPQMASRIIAVVREMFAPATSSAAGSTPARAVSINLKRTA